MPIPRINIDYQLAQIGLRTGHAQLNINKPVGQLTIKNERSQLQIKTQNASFKVNRRQLSSEMGLSSPMEFTIAFRNAGRSGALQAAGQYKSDGNFLARKEPGDKVPALAKNRQMARLGPKQTNIGLMPQSIPDLNWTKGSIDINWTKPNLVIDYNGKNTAEVSVDTNYPVEVFLQRRPYFRVSVEQMQGLSGRFVNSAV